ncbi:predicted protein [Streptomyces azureus]|uniref:Uncharacterized protein n=1 Tax=Streptomyces azureus TaxID=146537 RepID=A0A0K8PM68_STRAJ|nr:predicted protein [Streptomyces azureus]
MGTVAASISPMDIWSALMAACYSRVETAGQARVTTAAPVLAPTVRAGPFPGRYVSVHGQ